jgi:metal-sulfur cluster biosynthetic enzyme
MGDAMSRPKWYVVVLLLACFAIPGALYFVLKPSYSQDKQIELLTEIGYYPIRPPRNVLTLGSIYSIDPEVKFFNMICPASPEDLKDALRESPSERMIADYLSKTNYSAGLSGKSPLVAASTGITDKFLSKVQLKFTDVSVYELDLERSFEIFEKLMSRRSCEKAVHETFESGYYACQGRGLLRASAEYNVNQMDIKSAAVESGIDPAAAKKAIIEAAKAESDIVLQEDSNRLSTGVALHYGVSINPTCIAPEGAVFPRVLPRTRFWRAMNFIKFNLIEPILPRSKT